MIRGRPAIRVLGGDLEDPRRYPESELWALLVDEHRQGLVTITAATAAVRVTGPLPATATWVQGPATYLGDGLALTNRHVLLPPLGGTRIARAFPARPRPGRSATTRWCSTSRSMAARSGRWRCGWRRSRSWPPTTIRSMPPC